MEVENKIKVLIVDDHNMVRKGLRVLIEEFEELQVVGEAGDGAQATMSCETLSPDVVLMDLMMPHMNGIKATADILSGQPDIKVLLLTSFVSEEHVQDALQAGAVGYLMKNISGSELYDAIIKAHNGESSLAPEATQALIQATVRPPSVGHDLTQREREVLAHMMRGLNNREIGDELFISASTVKNHVSKVLMKLDTSSRTQAVALAIENGIEVPEI